MSALDTNDILGKKTGKALVSLKFDSNLGAFITHYDQGVSAGVARPSATFGVLNIQSENERNVGETRLKWDSATYIALTDKIRSLGAQELERFAVSIVETREVLNHQTLPALSFLSLSAQIESVDSANNLWKVRAATAFFPIVKQVIDEELGLPLTITEEVVDLTSGSTVPASTKGVFYTQTAVDSLRAIRTTIAIVGFPGTSFDRQYNEDITFQFPSLLTNATFSNGFLASQRRSIFRLQREIRNTFSAPVSARVAETIITASDAAVLLSSAPVYFPTAGHEGSNTVRAGLFRMITNDLNYEGNLFSFSANNVLNDAFTITATTNSNDTYYGAVTENPSFIASVPTKTEYLAAVAAGTEVCISEFIKPWKYGLYFRRRVFIKLV